MKVSTLMTAIMLLTGVITSNLMSQTTITIGNGTTTTYYAPVYISTTSSTNYYSDHISLFTAAEISNSGTIQSLAWEKSDATGYIANDATLNIYIKHTSATTVATTSGTYDTEVTGATLVYSSTTQNLNTSAGWQTFTLSTPFVYNGTDNLMILVEWYRPSAPTANYPYWYYTSATSQAASWSGTSSPPTSSYGANYRPNIQITFSPTAADDAGVFQVNSPIPPASIGLNNVEVTIRNFGTNNVTSADINWMVNGVSGATYNWAGTMTPGTTAGPILLGAASFINGNNIVKAWTTNPNGTTDGYHNNDTLITSVFACNLLNGTYTLGTISSDFPTFADAINALTSCGLSGPVIFNVASGTYTDKISIPNIPTATLTNTVTFQSATGINTDVIINVPSETASADNYTLQFNDAHYVTFQNMTIQRSGSNAYAGVIRIEGASSRIQLINNIITGQAYTAGTSTNYTLIYSPTTTKESDIIISDNELVNGGYAIHFDGASAQPENNIQITGNNIHGFGYIGIELEYALAPLIENNIVISSASPYTTVYGIYMYYVDDGFVINKNIVETWAATSNYCMYLYYSDATASNEALISNNFVTCMAGTGLVYGISSYYSNYHRIYNNSIHVTAGSATTGRGLYLTSASTGTYGNIKILNNNVVNSGGGYAIEIPATAVTLGYVLQCDFNNFYTTGTSIGSYNGVIQANLAAWQTASPFDDNSVSANPNFTSANNLHISSPALNGEGTPIMVVTDDIDGDVRSNPPDIGADEFTPVAADAGVSVLNSPVQPAIPGVNNIEVIIKNFGTTNLTSVDIDWLVNGTPGTTHNWAGTLTPGSSSSPILIGTATLITGNNTIKAWTANPNGVSDGNTLNDTINSIILACNPLNGNYTLGTISSDYPTFNDAISAILSCGISGPVVFNIASGTYTDKISIPDIPGTSATNTITFQSATGNSADVLIDIPSETGSANNYALQFNDAHFVIFQNVSIKRSGIEAYAGVIRIEGGTSDIQINNNIITGQNYTGTSTNYTLIYSSTTLAENNISITDNELINGGYAIHFDGASAQAETGINITGNNIHGFSYMGIELEYALNPFIEGNDIISASSPNTTVYGIYMYYVDDGFTISKNTVETWAATSNYCVYLYYCDATVSNEALISNNFIINRAGTGLVYGISSYYSNYHRIFNNSINITSGSTTTGRGLYLTSASTGTYGNIKILNNNVVNSGGGFAIDISSTAVTLGYVTQCDFNNFYSTGSAVGNYNAIAQATLTAWQSASPFDDNSVSVNPSFTAVNNLHTYSPGINDIGTPIAVITDDIDGEARNVTTPDIGADEFTPSAIDIGATALISPATGNCYGGAETVAVRILNFGTADIDFSVNPASVDVSASGINPQIFTTVNLTTGTLTSGSTMDVTITTSYNMSAAGNYIFDASATVTGDGNATNNSMSQTSITSTNISTFPAVENFETFTIGTPGTFNNGWTSYSNSTYAWHIDAGGTPSTSTGPAVDHTLGTTAGIYLFTEASNGAAGDSALLISPCLSLSSLTVPTLKFWYHMYGANCDYLAIDARVSGVWQEAYSITGEQQISNADAWKLASVNLSSYSTADKIRFRTQKGASFYGDIAVDDIQIDEAEANDLAVISWTSQPSSCGLTAAESITIEIANYGLNAQSNVPFSYSINNGTSYITEIVAGPINPGDTVSYTFTATADFSVNGTYNCIATTSDPADQNHFNDSLFIAILSQATVSSYPMSEKFESFTVGTPGTLLNDWTRTPATGYTWYVDAAGTPTTTTGPTVDHTLNSSTGKYMYVEASNGSAGNEAILTSPCIDLSSMANPSLVFWFHMCGVDIDVLHVDIMESGVWTTKYSINGPQQANEADDWQQVVISLSGNMTTEKFRFRTIRGSGTGGYGDIAIDDINITEANLNDLQVVEWVSPNAECGLTSAETVSIKITNLGILTQSNVPFSYSIDGGTTVINETVPGPINSGDTITYAFTTAADFSAVYTYNCEAYSSDITDQNHFNDSIFTTIVTQNSVAVYPHTEDFETFVVGSPGTFMNGWSISPTTGFRWQVNAGLTLSTLTGPQVDHTLGTAAGKYVYTEASSGSAGNEAILLSPCLDLSSMTNPFLKFWYHMFGADVIGLNLDVRVGGIWINNVFSLTGQQQSSETDIWKMANVDLTAYSTLDKIRFRVIHGASYYGDIAIDDIYIYEPVPNDLSVISWIAPVSGQCGLTSAESITVKIYNNGTAAQSNIPFTYSIDNGATFITDEIVAGPINPGDTLTYTFTTTADFSSIGSYSCIVASSDITDQNHLNDSLWKTIITVPVISAYPYLDDFESTSYWTSGGTNSTWALGTPAGTIINTAASGANSWETNLTGNYNLSENSWVIGPCFDFSSLTAPIFEMKAWWNSENSYDGAALQYSTNNGLTWTHVGTYLDPNNWYNDNTILGLNFSGSQIGWTGAGPGNWVTVKHDLTGLAGLSNVKLRIAFGSDGSVNSYNGFAFDDVEIYDPPSNDLAVISWNNPLNSSCAMGSEDIEISVYNAGTQPQTNFNVSYSIDNGATWISELVTSTILSGDTLDYTFLTQADFSIPGTYDCMAVVSNAGDMETSNDTINFSITSLVTVSSYPYFENFESVNYWTSGGTNSTWALGTPAGTIINTAASGANSWETNLTGNYNLSENSWVTGPCFDFSSLTAPIFEMKAWWNSENSYDGAALQYSTNNGLTWTHVGTYLDPNNWYNDNTILGLNFSGSQIGWTGAGPGNWVKVKHDLTGLGGLSNVKLRIAFGSDGSVNSYNGFAFDDVLIYDTPQFDISPITWVSPSSGCLSASEIINVTFTNLGLLSQDTVMVSYSIDNGATFITPEMMIQVINPGSSYTYAFTTPADLSIGGIYNCIVVVSDVNDQNHFNDTLYYSLTNNLVNLMPYTEDFETSTVGFPGTLANGWTTTSNTTYKWHVHNGTTPTASTGANYDHTLGSVSGKYVYTEADNGITNDTAYLYFPCLDLSSYSTPALKFWYHMYGSDIATLSVDAYDNGWVNDIYTLTGQQQDSSSAPWIQAEVDLTLYTNATIFRFRAVKGAGNLGDICIDDINLYEAFHDLGVAEISSPSSACTLYSFMSITVKATNFGTITYITGDTISVGLEFNGNPVAISDFILTTDFLPGASKYFMFPGPYNMAAVGNYEIIAYTIHPEDVIFNNDTAIKIVSHYGPPAVDLGADINTTNPDTVMLDAGIWDTYLWTGGDTTQTFDVDTAGYYSVTVTDIYGCVNSDTIYVGIIVGNMAYSDFGRFEIYPNPSDGKFTIELNERTANAIIELMDINGQSLLIHQEKNSSQLIRRFDVSDLAKGIYYIRITADEGTWVEKLILQ